MKKNNWQYIIIALSMIFIILHLYYNRTCFDRYFSEYNKTFCITTDKQSGTSGMSQSVRYTYRVGGIIYKGKHKLEDEYVKVPDGKYLIVYSVKDPTYHVFFPISINGSTINIDVSKNEIKNRFDVANRAKKIKGKYSSEGKKVPSVP